MGPGSAARRAGWGGIAEPGIAGKRAGGLSDENAGYAKSEPE